MICVITNQRVQGVEQPIQTVLLVIIESKQRSHNRYKQKLHLTLIYNLVLPTKGPVQTDCVNESHRHVTKDRANCLCLQPLPDKQGGATRGTQSFLDRTKQVGNPFCLPSENTSRQGKPLLGSLCFLNLSLKTRNPLPARVFTWQAPPLCF